MRLYNSQLSGNCYKVRLLLSLLEIPYERVEVDVVDRSKRRKLLGGKNPALRVPTLELDGGVHLAESSAILWYLADGPPNIHWRPRARATESSGRNGVPSPRYQSIRPDSAGRSPPASQRGRSASRGPLPRTR